MRLFLIGWAESYPELVDTAEDLEKNGHNIVYWARNEEPISVDQSRFPNTAFHSYHEARNSIPTKRIPCDKFSYPSSLLLKGLASEELLVLTMMNKIYPGVSVSERGQLFIQFVRYWLGVIRQFNPDFIFFNTTPHAPLYFTLYILAKHLKIKTAMFDLAWVSDRILWMEDFREGSATLRGNYLRLSSTNPKIEGLSLDIRTHYERHVNPAVDTTPSYLTEGLATHRLTKKIMKKIGNFFSSVLSPNIFSKKAYRFYINFPNIMRRASYYFRFNLPRAYQSLSLECVPSMNRKFIYVALHLQPECTTNPVGEVFQDQVFLIQTLSDALPSDWVIYVKEHPFQWPYYGIGFSEDRYRSYYERIAKIPKVSLIPIKTRSLDLISKAQAVATVSGTVGWEAVLRGKPALVFGNAWYQYAPGVMRVRNVDDCRKALNLIQNNFSVSGKDKIAFLLALDQSSIHGYIDEWTKKVSAISPEENSQNFLKAFRLIFR